MQDKWIKDIFNEKVMIELSNPIMHSMTGDSMYQKDTEETAKIETVMEELRNINKTTKNLITVFESQTDEIDDSIIDKINEINKNIIELNTYLKNK